MKRVNTWFAIASLISPAAVLLFWATLAPVARAEKISGQQVLRLSSASQAIANNTLYYIPCAPVNSNCKALRESFLQQKQQVDAATTARSIRYRRCTQATPTASCGSILLEDIPKPPGWRDAAQTTKSLISQGNQLQTVQTDAMGRFQFDCPTQNCLVQSTANIGLTEAVWFQILPAGKTTNLINPSALNYWPEK